MKNSILKRKKQRLTAGIIAWAMLLTIFSGTFFPISRALAATPSTLNAGVSVTGVADGGTINGSTGVEVSVAFPVPVEGDGVSDYFHYQDEVILLLSTSFRFDPLPAASIDLMYGAKKLGTVTLSNNEEGQAVSKIKFDGDEDVFDPGKLTNGENPYSGVTGMFKTQLRYNGSHDTDASGNKTVSLLEKTYKLQLPGDIVTYMVAKKAEGTAVNLDEGTVTWTVTITAAKNTEPAPTHIDLEGYVFEDDLSGVGEYVESFLLAGGTVLQSNLSTPDAGSTKLTYTFPAGSVSPQTLAFKTKIPEDILTAGGSITNAAGLYLSNKKVGSGDFTATITKPSATKWGQTDDDSSGITYDPTGRSITWYIEVNSQGRTLNDLTITDELKNGLSFDWAQWQKWNDTDSKWEDLPGVSWTTEPDANRYKIGEKTGGGVNYFGRLKLVTKVPDSPDGSVTATDYHNQAAVSWLGSSGAAGSTITANPGVGIGYDALSKSGTQSISDVKNHQITWMLDVNMKGQSAGDFKVYDLFVHDAGTSNSDLVNAAGWPSGLLPGSAGIARNNGQSFVAVVYKDGHLTVNPIDLLKDGKVIATLIEIKTLRNSGSNQLSLKSRIIAPDTLAGNDQTKNVYNLASLYKGGDYRCKAEASVLYNNKILSKELLNRSEVSNEHTSGAAIDADNRTTDAARGFHYGYREAIFRLNINASGIDFSNVATNLTNGFGTVAVTDTLPVGWEFAKFSGGQDYLIYEAAEKLSTGSGYPPTGSLTTSGSALASVAGLTAAFDSTSSTHTVTFSFDNLNRPYVVLVKARPSNATFDAYLMSNSIHNEANTLSISSVNWQPGKNVSQLLKVDGKVLDKTLDLSKQNQGILTWSVNYTPFGREIGTGLEDTLPQGIDLRTDSSGKLIWEQDGSSNISVRELTLKTDGSGEYSEGSELSQNVLKSVVSYDNNTRKLTFAFPDKAKAYKLTYVTDITGTPANVTNSVKLVAADGTGPSTNRAFAVTAQQGMATMGRSGYLLVKKTDIGSVALANAEFTLYNTSSDGSKASSRAVRTTAIDGTVKFYGLAPGNYILAETIAPGDYENPPLEYSIAVSPDLKTTVNGSFIVTGSTPFVVVNYKATDPVGSLTLRKTVAGNGADTAKTFDFTLTLSGAAAAYTYSGHGVPGGTITSGDTVSLANGQSITIVGLPAGTVYKVNEADYAGDGYTTTSTGDTGSIMTNTTHQAAFINTRNVWQPGISQGTGILTIKKAVAGADADNTKKFNFTVILSGAAGSYNYTGNGVPNGAIKSGGIISLAHGQSITINGLPAGMAYQVTEEKASAQDYTVESTGSSGSISSSMESTASFTNTKLPVSAGSLKISKKVTGHGADMGKRFDFTVSFTGATGEYSYSGAAEGTIHSGGTLSLAAGESITITGLPAGTQYTAVEADYTGEGYTASSAGATGIINAAALQTATFTNTYVDSPGTPGKPEIPGTNIGGGSPGGTTGGNTGGMPQTGDNQTGGLAKLGLLFFSAVLVAVIAFDFALRKKYSAGRNKK